MKNIAILGSSGSIGRSALEVVRAFPGKFRVSALSVNSDISALKKQIKEFRPGKVCVADPRAAFKLKNELGSKTRVLCGKEGLMEIAGDGGSRLVVMAITGSAALDPLLGAIKSSKEIALANKEALVMAGDLLMRLAKKYRAQIRPVDSEQSAIWQSLGSQSRSALRRVYLTASGGPLREVPRSRFKDVTLEKVLRHPRWKMGRKITVDSATLMNKGLELLEAMFLFGLKPDEIKVLVHPEALIHSMVEFSDGVVMAQLSVADMRIPIQYALSYPERFPNKLAGINFCNPGKMHFLEPDLDKFPSLRLAYYAARELGTLPAVMNAANEICVDLFLNKKIEFLEIPEIVEKVMRRHKNVRPAGLSSAICADAWAREEALAAAGRI
ncbi:MAG: 1-deoxy-D-xylulose-5-phosphate reductoisomerase [Candidatus Omnitrophica bacterium]|nr:1-deoxy-D-xylulose-5-phosphate reductoisomerase [Candidatus Omnitrophota bacterium]